MGDPPFFVCTRWLQCALISRLTVCAAVLNYIRRNKEWIFSGIGVAILAGAFTLFFGRCSKKDEYHTAAAREPARQQRLDSRVLASEAGVGQWKTTANEALERIRDQHNVKLMDALDNELQFSRVPRGVFGFVSSYGLEDLKSARIYHSKLPWYFEIHKMLNGDAVLVGFVSSDTAQHVSRDDTPTNFLLTMYSEPWPDAVVPIAWAMNNLLVSGSARSIRVANLDFAAIDIIINCSKPK